MNALRMVLAVNPAAAFGRTASAGAVAAAELRSRGAEVRLLMAADWASLQREVAAAVQDRPDAVVVVGGDGMVNLGVNAVAGTGIPLGLVPSGTGNDFARMFALPPGDPAAAVDRLLAALAGGPRRVDLGRAETSGSVRWFAGVFSAGFDAAVNERANAWAGRRGMPRGMLRYQLAMLRGLAGLKPLRYRLVVDGVPRVQEALLISVANGRFMGGGMMVAPQAEYDDGRLELFIVAPLSRARFLAVFPKVYTGRHLDHPAVSIERVRSVRLEAAAVVGYADGERFGPLPASIDVVPGALLLLA